MSLKTKSLSGFLDHKTMYYDKIDFSFVNRAFSILEKEIKSENFLRKCIENIEK